MNITRKELEKKAAKTFRKANRLKATALKLEKIDEFLETLWDLNADESGVQPSVDEHRQPDSGSLSNLVDAYIDLCLMHKLKFQLDALFDGVRTESKHLAQAPNELTQVHFDQLVQRLHVVMEIDNHYPEVEQLLNMLRQEFPQFAAHSTVEDMTLDLTPYQRPNLLIDMSCRLSDLTQNSQLEPLYKRYQRKGSADRQASSGQEGEFLTDLRFTQQQLSEFDVFHEELRTKPGYSIAVNAHPVEERIFSEWLQCYQRFLKAKTPQYCYGASSFTFNVFGCHKLRLPDVAKCLEQCWFHYGMLDKNSRLFILDASAIITHIRSHLPHCGFCPALTQEKLLVGLGILPRQINPECDPGWKYFSHNEHAVEVVPTGHDIAIALSPTSFSSHLDPAAFLEVGQTPYIEKALKYLETHSIKNLAQTSYRNLSHCLHCGAPYKLHTMACSQCKMEFWKLAIRDPQIIVEQLKYTKIPDMNILHQGMTEASPTASHPKAVSSTQEAVSFEQLWSDPEVRKILLHEEEPPPESVVSPEMTGFEEVSEESVEQPELFSETSSSGRFDLHGKLRSLLSQKYRERKAIEEAFTQSSDMMSLPGASEDASHAQTPLSEKLSGKNVPDSAGKEKTAAAQAVQEHKHKTLSPQQAELLDALKKLKPRKKSELSKRGVVRVIYHATMDKETCPLCAYLDGMVMDPDDPATDIFSPPLFPECTCRREYVLKTEKPSKWPPVTFKFPPEELLGYLQKKF